MALIDHPAQSREAHSIWLIFSALPLYAALADGRIFEWFAVNIPMDLGTGGEFTSDIDVIACLRDFTQRGQRLYKCWEVKVGVLRLNGEAKSLKAGKTGSILRQLRAYRAYGCGEVSLLDVFLCEEGYLQSTRFPSEPVSIAVASRLPGISAEGFGHQLLPFESDDVGDRVSAISHGLPAGNIIELAHAVARSDTQPFTRLVSRLHEYAEASAQSSAGPRVIVFCRRCRKLVHAQSRSPWECPSCGTDLTSA
jgi:hypothetical protein